MKSISYKRPPRGCGAPVDAAYARNIGADGYGEEASEAARLARSLIQNR